MVNTSVETIRELNPSLLRMTTPKVPEYTLRIPLATRDLFVKRIAMIPAEKRVFWRWHTVRHGESLSSIAKQFKTSVNAIAEVNNLDPRQPLFEAAELVIPVGRNGAGPVGPLAGPGERHRVERGETLSIIARKYSVTTEQLIAWNDLDGTLIRAGSALIVGPEEDPQPTRAANGRHVVRRNETLAIIARRYGVTVSQLMTWNNLRTTLIRVGDTLTVRPQGSPTATADGSGRIIATASASSPASVPSQPLVHRVKKGESLSVIAVSYNTSVEALRRNNLHLGRTLQVGDPVYISNSK
jgi:membrane-bound lytic murein transglycosylase D